MKQHELLAAAMPDETTTSPTADSFRIAASDQLENYLNAKVIIRHWSPRLIAQRAVQGKPGRTAMLAALQTLFPNRTRPLNIRNIPQQPTIMPTPFQPVAATQRIQCFSGQPRRSKAVSSLPRFSFIWLLVTSLLLLAAPAAFADRSPPGCTGSGLGISLFTSIPDVHVGDTISYSVNVFNTPFPACDASGIQAFIVTPDGVSHPITLRRTTLVPGESDLYTDVVSYVVRAQDIRSDGTLRATATDEGDIHQNDTNSRGGGNQGVNTEVNQPCILLTVVCGVLRTDGSLTFSGTVTNCGNNTLVGVTVTNYVNGGAYTVLFPTNLAIGQTANFTGSWVPTNPCAPSTATLVAQGTDQFTATPRTVTSTANTACQLVLTPGIKVTKSCPATPVLVGQLLTFSGSVSNSGNVALTNIVVVDDQPAANTVVFTRSSLAPGQSVAFTGSYTAPANCSSADTLTATASSLCGVAVSSFASVTCPIVTAPAVAVTLLCPANPIVPGGVVTFTGTVRNSGNITLNNVLVLQNGQSLPVSGLRGYWSLDETSGTTAFDNSGNGNDGAIIGATRVAGEFGNALNFGGTNAYVDIANSASMNFAGTITMSAWIRPQSVPGVRNVFAHGFSSSPNAQVFLRLQDGFYQAGAANATTTTILNAAIPAGDYGNWVHLAATYDGATWTLYRNGVVIGSTTGIAPVVVNANWAIGAKGGGGQRFFSGAIDEVRLYDRALSQAEIGALSGLSVLFFADSLAPGALGNFTLSGVAAACAATANVIATGQNTCSGATVTNRASATCPVPTAPAIAVSLSCPSIATRLGTPITYVGTVRNSGNITLSNVTVINPQTVPNTVLSLPSLPPGATADFSATFTAPLDACTVSTSVTASGSDSCSAARVSNIASATCGLLAAPKIAVRQNCPGSPATIGGQLVYSGSVSNAGDLTLTNIVVTNDRSGAAIVFSRATLAPGAVANFTGSYTVPADAGCSITSTLTASGADKCGGTIISATSAATCALQGSARIAVSLACPANPVAMGGTLTFSGTVSNPGNVALNNIVVTRDSPSPSVVVFTVATLAPGASTNFSGSYVTPGTNACTAVTAVTAHANDQCVNGAVINTASISCPLVSAPRIIVTQNCSTNPTSPGGVLTFSGTVCNPGNVTLTNITVFNDQQAPATSGGPATFGTIGDPLAPPAGAVTDRFGVGNNFTGLTFAPQDEGYAANNFYALRREVSGSSTFTTINANGTVTGRFDVGNKNFDALTFAAPDVGYGPVIFYYLRHDSAGVSTFGTMSPGGVVGTTTDRFVVGNNFDALTFTATDVGFGANMFYYLRHDGSGRSTLGTINPALPGTITDRFAIGTNFDALVFTATDVGYGANLFYYLRHDGNGRSTFGTISATGTVTDRFNVGTNFNELAFATTDVGFGANLFYFLRGGGKPQPVLAVATLAPGACTNFSGSYVVPASNVCSVTAVVTATGMDTCSGNTVTNVIAVTCPLTTTPRIAVTLNCPNALSATGGSITYNGIVSNIGDVALNNVTVVDAQSSPTTVFSVATLPPGASANFTASFLSPSNSCSVSSTVTASGKDACTANTVSASASATCPLLTAPRITVTENCPTNPATSGGLLVYSGTVSNAGNITVTNIVVTNDRTGTTPVFTIATLAPRASAGYTGSYLVPANSGCAIGSTVTAVAADTCTGARVFATASATCPLLTAPGLSVTENCPANPVSPGGLLTYSGTVMNTGNVTLTNIIVTNDHNGTTPIFTAGTLAPGASASFTGSYTVPLTGGCSSTSRSTATAANTCTGVAISASASSTCPILTTPAIEVTQFCPPTPVLPGGILTYTGSVSNEGNITLTNVMVFSNLPGSNTLVFTIATLAPGATTNFTGSYKVPLNCCVVSSTLRATGRDICTGALVDDTFTATCTVLTLPKIVVTKVCPATAVQTGDVLHYSGTVSNAGNITLVNVLLVNNQPIAGSPVWGPITLAPGESVTYYAAYTVLPDFCGTDTVTARGLDACTYAAVSDSATTTCAVITTPRIFVTKNCPALPTPRGGLFTFTGSVSNSGNVTLTNVTVVNNYEVDCFTRTNGPVIGPITLAPGAAVNFSGSYIAPRSCCEVLDTLTASGQATCTGTRVSATASALCPLLSTPRITVVRVCSGTRGESGSLFSYTGSVSNAGDVVLTNVYVISSKPTGATILGPIELAPGESEEFAGSYIATAGTDPALDTVTARGQDTCQGRLVSASANCLGPVTPLNISSVTVSNGIATVKWTATPGTTYRLLWTSNYQNSVWNTVAGDTTPTTASGIKQDNVGTNTPRFYRLMIVP